MQGSSKPDRQLLDTGAFWRHLVGGVTVKINSNRPARFGKYWCLNQQSPRTVKSYRQPEGFLELHSDALRM